MRRLIAMLKFSLDIFQKNELWNICRYYVCTRFLSCRQLPHTQIPSGLKGADVALSTYVLVMDL